MTMCMFVCVRIKTAFAKLLKGQKLMYARKKFKLYIFSIQPTISELHFIHKHSFIY